MWASPPRADGLAAVVAETTILAGVRGRAAELARLAVWNAREPGLSALCWRSQPGEVALRAAVLVGPGDSGSPARLLAHAALLQAGESLRAADVLAIDMPDARLVASAPPAGVAVPAGAAVPVEQTEAWRAYAGGSRARVAALAAQVSGLVALAPAPWVRATRAAHGIDAEIACGDATRPGEGTALLRVSATQPHPRLGAGLMLALVPPRALEPLADRVHATAALLNEAECNEWTGIDQLGGWCVHPAAGLSHVTFVPALAAEDDTATRLAWQAAVRSRWALDFIGRVAALRTQPPDR